MIIQEGHTYECKNGIVVTVRRSNLPFYKFTVEKIDGITSKDSEVWSEEGVAYHDDCGYNFVSEVVDLQYESRLTIAGRGEVCLASLTKNGLTIRDAINKTVLVDHDLYTITSVEHRGEDDLVGFIIRPKKVA